MNAWLPEWSEVRHPVIGMLHAPPLPGSPRCESSLEAVLSHVLRDADALTSAGVHGLLLENFGDAPFYPDRVPVHVVAGLTRIAVEVRRRFEKTPLGINVLRNDGCGALAVAHASGASFIRVNVLCGARVADQGVLSGIAHELLRERRLLNAESIRILADVSVKHSAPLGPERPVEEETRDTIQRGGAEGVVASGSGTGSPTQPGLVARVAGAAGSVPVFVGSGVTPNSIDALARHAYGFIVGTSLKVGGVAGNPVDPARVRELMASCAATGG